MERIIQTVLALGGDLFGETMFKELRCSPNVSRGQVILQCRLDPPMIPVLVNLVRSVAAPFGRGTRVSPPTTTQGKSVLNITAPYSPEEPPIVIEITPLRRAIWNQEGVRFDVHLLAMSNFSVFCRMDYPELEHISCKVGWLLNRVHQKRFALLDNDGMSPKKLAGVMAQASSMIEDGWHMDDMIHGKNAWVVSKWQDTKDTRVKEPEGAVDPHHDECAICKEDFEPNDIVVNLRCNHSFHVRCKQACGGMEQWLLTQETDSCPMCRAAVASSLKVGQLEA